MIRRVRALLEKELRQHALAGLGLVLLLGLGVLSVLVRSLSAERTTSLLESVDLFLVTFIPLAAVVLGHRLVVLEFQGRTQPFLQALPVRPFEPVLVKYALGLLPLLAVQAGATLLVARLARGQEPVGARFLGILLARGATFTAAVYTFFFAMGFTGRLRVPIYLGTGLIFGIIHAVSEFDIWRFGPFALVAFDTFPFERNDYPVRALAQTAAIGLGSGGLALALALVREGTLSESLARRMSQKEKVVVFVLAIAGLTAITYLDKRKTKKPYEFTGDAILKSGRVPLELLYIGDGVKVEADALFGALERDLVDLSRDAGLPRLPPVRVAWHGGLDGRTFDHATLDENDGVLIRANFSAKGFDERGFRAEVLRETLDHALEGRASFEPKRWFLDGFARYFVERLEPSPPTVGSIALLRAMFATRERAVTVDDLVHWVRARERLGDPVAEGLAFSGVAALEAAAGRGGVAKLARALYGREAARDVREVFYERANPMEVVFERETGIPYAAFVERWNAFLERGRGDPAEREALARLPRGDATLAVERGEGDLRAIRWSLRFERPPPEGTPCALVHLGLGAFDHELEPHELRRDERLWPKSASAADFALEGTYGRGRRAFAAIEVEVRELGCAARLAASRLEIP